MPLATDQYIFIIDSHTIRTSSRLRLRRGDIVSRSEDGARDASEPQAASVHIVRQNALQTARSGRSGRSQHVVVDVVHVLRFGEAVVYVQVADRVAR